MSYPTLKRETRSNDVLTSGSFLGLSGSHCSGVGGALRGGVRGMRTGAPGMRGAPSGRGSVGGGGNRLDAGDPRLAVLAAGVGLDDLRGELATGAVDVRAAGVADGRGEPVVAQGLHEDLLHAGTRGGPLRALDGVQRDGVDVHPVGTALGDQAVGEQLGPVLLVVDVADQRVLDADAAAGGLEVLPRGIEAIG